MSLQNEGTIAFWLVHHHPDWQVNDSGYGFGPFLFPQFGLGVAVLKHPDKRLDVTISGPFQWTTAFNSRVPDLITQPNLHVAIIWSLPRMNLYLNGRPVGEKTLAQDQTQTLVRETMPIVIRGQTPAPPPQDTVDEVVDQLCGVFSTIEAFFDASDLSTLEAALQSGLERPKFGVQDSGLGSWRGILAGTRRAFEFAKDKLGAFFAILAGKGERLAEAFVRTKEAEAEHKQSDAAVAKEKARQEQIETLARAMEVAKQLQTQIANLRNDLPDERKLALLGQYLLPPMERMGLLLLENNLTMDISPDQTGDA